jgi:catechol 2,3-dioxygenase-like lactoylglutathione lyase family enzyme
MLTPFHLAINVTDLETTRVFYGEVLGAKEGRSTRSWVDFDFFGHQLSFHLGPVMKTEHRPCWGSFGSYAAFRYGSGPAGVASLGSTARGRASGLYSAPFCAL